MELRNLSFGRFSPDRRIGAGGMAEVWSATGEPDVALKILSEQAARDPRLVRAVRTEVRIAAGLCHPGIIQILDTGEVAHDGFVIPWIAMERARGSLVEGLEQIEPLQVLAQVLKALAHAHARGVLHRDVKPGNVLQLGERWVLSDFGLAATTTTGRVHGGSPGYAAPEQLRGATAEEGPWTDIYAVGAMAWALCTGRAPSEPSDLQSGEVPEALVEWIARAGAYAADRRFRHAADALAALPQTWTTATAPMHTHSSGASSTQFFLYRDGAQTSTEAPDHGAPPPSVRHALPTSHPPDAVPQAASDALAMLVRQALPGQVAARDAVWKGLQRADRGERAVVLVSGEPGSGRHALVTRLLEAAAESGAVAVTRIRASPLRQVGPAEIAAEALGPMHGGDIDPDRVGGFWGIADPALAELLDRSLPVLRLHTPKLLYCALGNALQAWADARICVIAVEEAEHSPESLSLATEHLDQLPERSLVLLTVGTGTPGAEARDFLDRLPAPHPMAPVPVRDGESLAWQDALDLQLGLPDPDARLERLEPSARSSLEVAAILGRDVDQDLWIEVSQALDRPDPREALPTLIGDGWLEPEGRGRRLFRSVALRRAVLEGLDQTDAHTVRRAVADALIAQGPSRALAEHLLALDERPLAARTWYSAASERSDLSALALEELEARMAVDPPDLTTVAIWLMRFHLGALADEHAFSVHHLDKVKAYADRTDDPIAHALWMFGRGWNSRRDDGIGSEVVESGILMHPPAGLETYWTVSHFASLHAELAWQLDRKDEAIAGARRSLELSTSEGHRLNALLYLTRYSLSAERLDEAEAWADELGRGTPLMTGSIRSVYHQVRAFIAELRNDIPTAEREMAQSVEIRDAMQIAAPYGRVNHAVYLAQLGRHDEAERRLEEAGEPVGVDDYLFATRLAVHAVRGQVDDVWTLLEGAAPKPLSDLAPLYEQAAANLASVPELAERCRELAALARAAAT